MHERLRRFWSVVSIQDFWSGESFHQVLVEQLARDWAAFPDFALRDCLGLDLGEAVTALLERDTPKSWSPAPAKWRAAGV